ncbi:hypothetical protein GCM10018987_14340 [Streptomyces cremeus]
MHGAYGPGTVSAVLTGCQFPRGRGLDVPSGPRETVGLLSGRRWGPASERFPTMPRLISALLTSLVAAALAVGAAFGIVALLDATPEQPNVPLVSYETGAPRR